MKYLTIIVLALSLSVCSSQKSVKKEPFTVNFNSPKIPAGSFEGQFDKLLGLPGLRQTEITVSYFPVEDAVCLQYRIDFMTYYLFWSREGREAFLSALEKYKDDFTQKNLKSRGNRNTRRRYGKADCYLIWQAAFFTVRARAQNVTELGYDIKTVSKNKASFFTLYQRESIYQDELLQTERRNTTNIMIYLTRTKADELAELFKQDYLDSLVPDKIKNRNEEIILDTLQ